MKSLVVFARIIIVGCLWSIVFIEGIRVIMLCNWHFDIFWPDHWRQAYALWNAGWVIRAPKEWAFVIILLTFFPMLITGWWTLCMVAWENIIYDIIMSPVMLYRRLIKAPINVMKTNNKYGVVKRKSYKQIRPTGVGGFRMPISDYSDAKNSQPPARPMVQPLAPAVPLAPKPAMTSGKAPIKKADASSTLDHALFKFDDDDDDFDLDIDSFEKADILKKKDTKPKPDVVDEFADDDDDFQPKPRKNKNNQQQNSNKRQQRSDSDYDEDNDDYQPKNNRKNDENRNKNSKNSRNDNKSDKQQNRNKADRADKVERNNNATDSSNNNNSNQRSPVYDILQQKGYDIISGINVNNTLIDYVGVSNTEICLCLVDKESGDWLADEELFNGEEPLWFSENSHRISPVRKLDVARNLIRDKLAEEDFEQEIKSYVVVQMANIINADDMFEIWNNMDIDVTRVNRGSPKEIRLFSKTVDEAESSMERKEFEKLRRILKSIK